VTHVMKKAGITIIAAVFVAAICLPILTLPSKAYADTVPYTIGDTGPAGGIIFYVDGSSCLEAAPSDQGRVVWSNIQYVLIGTTGTAIDTGQANTTAIIGQHGPTGNSAAKLCDVLSITFSGVTYDDWFLPSKDELNLMYSNLGSRPANPAGFDLGKDYWSSSEINATTAWGKNFSAGTEPKLGKTERGNVRAIRAFTGMKETGSAVNAPITQPIEKPWVRTGPMTCYRVWINEDNKFQFVFWYPYRDNNWVRIYDMASKMVYEIDMPYDNPNLIVDLPNGMYTVKTFTVGSTEPIQTFLIGK
jgi:hypothetical protein